MAKADETEEQERLELVHPVYLATPMMVSFVAAIEGGVAYGDERTQRTASASDRDREKGAKVGIPLLSSLLNLDMSGRWTQQNRDEGSEEIKVVRQQTEASLFNLLRHRLVADGHVTTVTDDAHLNDLAPGHLIEISGEVVGNPLEQMFKLLRQMLPYMGLDEDQLRAPKKSGQQGGNPRSGNPAKRAAAQQQGAKVDANDDDMSIEDVVRLLFVMRDDFDTASVRDLILQGPDTIKAVLTLSREFFTDETTDYLLGGRFTVLGKVTRVLGEDETINLTRRTALGIGGPDLARNLVEGFTEDKELFVEVSDPIVEAPGVQVLPLAVFV